MNELEMRALYQRLLALRSDASRSNCVAPEQIVALAEASLPEAERLRLLRHVSACSYCQRDLSLARSVALTRRAPAGSVARWAGLAAAAVVLVAAVLVWRPVRDAPDVMRSPDAALTLVAPSGVVTPDDTVFAWRAVPGALRYRVEVLTGAGTVVHSNQTTDTTIALRRGALASREYFWRVTAFLNDGSTRASPALRFDVRN